MSPPSEKVGGHTPCPPPNCDHALRLHGCCGSFRPTYTHHVAAFPAFNRPLLAPVTGPFFDVLDRFFAVNGTDAPTLLGVSVGIFFPLAYSTCCR